MRQPWLRLRPLKNKPRQKAGFLLEPVLLKSVFISRRLYGGNMMRKNLPLYILGGAVLVAMTAGASAFVTKTVVQDEKPVVVEKTAQAPKAEKITWNEPQKRPQTAQPQQHTVPSCDDGNVVGAIVGGVGGGVAGSQIGSGNGQTLATIGGALGGAYLGKEYIPTRNVTCK
jgi:uncharacterized protein YcfJ